MDEWMNEYLFILSKEYTFMNEKGFKVYMRV